MPSAAASSADLRRDRLGTSTPRRRSAAAGRRARRRASTAVGRRAACAGTRSSRSRTRASPTRSVLAREAPAPRRVRRGPCPPPCAAMIGRRRVERLHRALEAGAARVVVLAAEQVRRRHPAVAQRERGRLVGLESHLALDLGSRRGPGVPRSTTKARCPSRPRPGRRWPSTTIQSARLALAANDFVAVQHPVRRRPCARWSGSRATSEPAPGSVIANEPQRGRSGCAERAEEALASARRCPWRARRLAEARARERRPRRRGPSRRAPRRAAAVARALPALGRRAAAARGAGSAPPTSACGLVPRAISVAEEGVVRRHRAARARSASSPTGRSFAAPSSRIA